MSKRGMSEREKKSFMVWSDPGICGGEPMMWGSGARVVDLLDRIDAGDSVTEVADDFVVARPSLELLVEFRALLSTQPTPSTDKK